MNNFFRSKFFIVLIIITLLIFALMILSTISRDKENFAEDGVGIVVTPVQRFFYSIGTSTQNFFERFRSIADYRQENETLKSRVKELEEDSRKLYTLQNENERLKSLLQLQEDKAELKTVAAKVSAKDAGNWYYDFTINRGTSSGIKKKQPVINPDGLVGYVSEVGTTWAKVITIIDEASSVGAIINRTGDRAIVEGNLELSEDGTCKLAYISKGASMTVGDYVETSGLGGIYPAGLLIGRVKNFTADEQGLYHNAVVETAVNFEKIDEVLVIID